MGCISRLELEMALLGVQVRAASFLGVSRDRMKKAKQRTEKDRYFAFV